MPAPNPVLPYIRTCIGEKKRKRKKSFPLSSSSFTGSVSDEDASTECRGAEGTAVEERHDL